MGTSQRPGGPRLASDIGLRRDVSPVVEDGVYEQHDVTLDPSSPGLPAQPGSPEMRKAAPYEAAFPLSADRGSSSGEDPRGGGRVHQACRKRRETMRHSTTSFPLLKSKREMGAFR